MTVERHRVLPGTYCDSVLLMRLQVALEKEPGVTTAAAVMATPANREILEQSALWSDEFAAHRPDDLLIVVRAEGEAAAAQALERADTLLRQRSAARGTGRRFHSLERALAEHPDASWVALSIPGAHAAAVARQALMADRHVFLYSDNVSLDDEISLKTLAGERGRLLLGPDCGSAILGGRGFGFANRVERGPVGLIGASGTGLQTVCCRLDDLGVGVSQMIGTGGRDLSAAVGGRTTRQALALLAQDPETEVIALVSKPPAAPVAAGILGAAAGIGKPVVAGFVGGGASQRLGQIELAGSLEETAVRAAHWVGQKAGVHPSRGSGVLAGYFAGGTLALETALALARWLDPLHTNLGIGRAIDPAAPEPSQHRLIDLGDDAFTLGRPHPMIDDTYRLARLRQAADDPATGSLVVDVVLGDGAQADPTGELAPLLGQLGQRATDRGRDLGIGVLLVGSRDDPQDREAQRRRLAETGAQVFTTVGELVAWIAGRHLGPVPPSDHTPVDASALAAAPVIHLGLDSFAESLTGQGTEVVAVDWRPPAGGNPRLASILERMKRG